MCPWQRDPEIGARCSGLAEAPDALLLWRARSPLPRDLPRDVLMKVSTKSLPDEAGQTGQGEEDSPSIGRIRRSWPGAWTTVALAFEHDAIGAVAQTVQSC